MSTPSQPKRLSLTRLAIISVTLIGMAFGQAQAAAKSRTEIMRTVVQEAKSAGVHPTLALAIARVGSNFDARAEARSGELGVMQLHPRTAKKRFDAGSDALLDPERNIKMGVGYLKSLLERYDNRADLAVSHYFGMYGTSDTKISDVLPETSTIVRKVLAWQKRYQAQASIWSDLDPATYTLRKDSDRKLGDTFVGDDFKARRYHGSGDYYAEPRRYRYDALYDDDLEVRRRAYRGRIEDLYRW